MANKASKSSYAVRHDLNWRTGFVLIICVGFTACLVWVPIDGITGYLMKGVCVPLCVLGLVIMFMQLVSRRPAIEVDAEGIRLGVPWPRKVKLLPWEDVVSVEIFKQSIATPGIDLGPSVHYLGVRTYSASARQATGLENAAVALSQGSDHALVANSVPLTGWTFEPRQFAGALRHFAPGIPFLIPGQQRQHPAA